MLVLFALIQCVLYSCDVVHVGLYVVGVGLDVFLVNLNARFELLEVFLEFLDPVLKEGDGCLVGVNLILLEVVDTLHGRTAVSFGVLEGNMAATLQRPL